MNPNPPSGDPAILTFDPFTYELLTHKSTDSRTEPEVTADAATTSLMPAVTDTPEMSPAAQPDHTHTPTTSPDEGLRPPIRIADHQQPHPATRRVTGTLSPEEVDRPVLNHAPTLMPAFTAAPGAAPEPFATTPMPRYTDDETPPVRARPAPHEPDFPPEPEPLPAATRAYVTHHPTPAPAPPEPAGHSHYTADVSNPLETAVPTDYVAAAALRIAEELERVVDGHYDSFGAIRAKAAALRAQAAAMSPSLDPEQHP